MHLSPEMVDTVADYPTIVIPVFTGDLISLRNQRLANRVALHFARGGGFEPPAQP
mgnify:CR=1 FL=1